MTSFRDLVLPFQLSFRSVPPKVILCSNLLTSSAGAHLLSSSLLHGGFWFLRSSHGTGLLSSSLLDSDLTFRSSAGSHLLSSSFEDALGWHLASSLSSGFLTSSFGAEHTVLRG